MKIYEKKNIYKKVSNGWIDYGKTSSHTRSRVQNAKQGAAMKLGHLVVMFPYLFTCNNKVP